MKFVMERDAALRALGLAVRTAVRNTTNPILGHALITATKGRVALAVTNMDRSVRMEIAGAGTTRPGRTTANAYRMLNFIQATAEGSQVEAELVDEKLVLRSGRARVSLPTLSADDFPELPEENATYQVSVAADLLAKAMSRVVHCQSNEETRYYLNGIYLHATEGKVCLVATDGHRLALTSFEPNKELPADLPGIIIPRQSVPELQRLATDAKQAELVLEISESRLSCTHGDVEFSTRLVEGTFPDYHRVIPSVSECRFSANRFAFDGAVARCAALGSDENSAVKLTTGKGTVQLSRNRADAGEVSDEFDADVSPKGAVAGFNSKYMTDALAALDGDAIDVEFAPNAPFLLRSSADRDGQLQLVMVMRV